MNTTTASSDGATPAAHSRRTWAVRRVIKMLERLQVGTLSVHWPDGETSHFGQDAGQGHAAISLRNWEPIKQALRGGDIGFAKAYIEGHWHTPDLAGLLRLILANRSALDQAIYGHWAARLVYRLRHWTRRNSKANSSKNITAHYDLGNAFYELWLDPTMNYSSAIFDGDFDRDLSEAQKIKVRRALHMAGVTAGSRVLEIGCGWGALAEMATQEFDATAVGLTLSPAQLEYANERLSRQGHSARADLRLQDYRDLGDEQFDAICSIEMLEAVGQEYWATYFNTVAKALKPGGKACIQTIVIDDQHFDRYIKGSDFIQQMIFPGGCLPCPSAFKASAEAAGLEVIDAFAFGRDYAETLRRWRTEFMARFEQAKKLGFDVPFQRTWEFYLAYCEAGFDAGDVDVVQYTLQKKITA